MLHTSSVAMLLNMAELLPLLVVLLLSQIAGNTFLLVTVMNYTAAHAVLLSLPLLLRSAMNMMT